MPAYRLLAFFRRFRPALPAALIAAALLFPAPARAQSAADKATARQLATSGIKLYRASKYKDALDKLERAEALYDAPIHLLYIARCQVKIGKVVEGAETYRKLGRVTLPAGAPSAFKDAKSSGAKELEALEPQIPALRVEVQPADVHDVEVVIDGEHLPAAVVGIDRPANPGKHTVRVSAPGFEPAETTVEIKLGQKKPVALKLQASAGGAAPVGAGGGAGSGSPPGGGANGKKPGEPTTPPGKPALIGFMAGLRLGGAFFAGNAYKDPVEGDLTMADFAGAGFGGEIHGGIRIAKYITPVLFFQAGGLKPPEQSFTGPPPQKQALPSTTTGEYQGGGLGVIVGTPRNQLGFFGELDVSVDSASQSTDVTTPGGSCTVKETLSSIGPRLGGGGVIPIGSWLHLTPFVMVTVAKYTNAKRAVSGRCAALDPDFSAPYDESIPGGQRAIHSMFFVGVGGDVVFGSDKPAK